MVVTLLDVQRLTDGPSHHAFTSCVQWRDAWYVAHRDAPSHGIVPPGVVRIWRSADLSTWHPCATLFHGSERWPRFSWRRPPDTPLYTLTGDVRDPRLIASDEALYCLTGVYLPAFPRTTLHARSEENILQSHLSYTEDGEFWAPLQPIGRPGYWAWSALALQQSWMACAYHTGSATETSSLHLLSGPSLRDLGPLGMIYDGSGVGRDGWDYRYRHTSPSEPVLFQPMPETLACLARTEHSMEVGIARAPYQADAWRWWDTKAQIHPSAILRLGDGWLLAGREIVSTERAGRSSYATYTALWQMDAQFVTHRVLRLPSYGDTGYAGLCAAAETDEYLVSYYSQHLTGSRFGTTLPGAGVFVATVHVER